MSLKDQIIEEYVRGTLKSLFHARLELLDNS